MSTYISLQWCMANHGPIHCSAQDFHAEPDIAGSGILKAFVAVSFFACIISVVYLGVQLWQLIGCGGDPSRRPSRTTKEKSERTTWFTVAEVLIISCSDQQIFTGLAFGVSLRYYQGCYISAYHYNIVINMLLITCATHLVSVGIVRSYWQKWTLAIARIILITVVYVMTSVLFANQMAPTTPYFPTDIPSYNNTETRLTWPAACFQHNSTGISAMLKTSFNDEESFQNTMQHSKPKRYIHGVNLLILMLILYGVAIIGLGCRFLWKRCSSREESSGRGKTFSSWFKLLFHLTEICIVAGAFLTVIMSYFYIQKLRAFMSNTGLLNDPQQGYENPEDNVTTFGQMVPIILTGLTVLAFADSITDKIKDSWRNPKGSRSDSEQGYETVRYQQKY